MAAGLSDRRLARAAQRIEARAAKRSDRVRRSEIIGLCMFVAIPLPGTGAWTGALIAALMNMRLKKALPSITVGVLIAGAIVTAVIRLQNGSGVAASCAASAHPGQCCSPCCSAPAPTAAGCFSSGASEALR